MDELPQLFNVLIGDMSLVGPRPIIAPETKGYPRDNAYYNSSDFCHYAACTPGLTGLWQISGRNTIIYSRRVRLDRLYACKRSAKLDLLILVKTVPVVIGCTGSA